MKHSHVHLGYRVFSVLWNEKKLYYWGCAFVAGRRTRRETDRPVFW
jgi:hypothetical protein